MLAFIAFIFMEHGAWSPTVFFEIELMFYVKVLRFKFYVLRFTFYVLLPATSKSTSTSS